MALVVAALRVIMLLLNIYDSYKVLKPPRISARNSHPAVRALSQRKRKMKGCLAVWIVWCCYMTYERIGEGIVSLFIPFYDTCKSLVLLFLILTRARGAEPIFLHVIRPLLKPYTATLDAVSDVARMLGDLVFAVWTYPFRLVSDWWHTQWPPTADESQNAVQSVSQHPVSLQPGGGRRRSAGAPREYIVPFSTATEPNLTVARHRVAERGGDDPAPTHEIWHPPRSAYHDEDEDEGPEDGIHPALDPEVESAEDRQAREQMEEWRRYPPLPSAYPPTPLPPSSSRLPPDLPPVPQTEEARAQMEEWRRYPPFPSAYPPTPLTRPPSLPPAFPAPARFSPVLEDVNSEQEQDFGRSLPLPLEPPIPGSMRGASDEDASNLLGISVGAAARDDAMDEEQQEQDDDDDDEDDDFDVTLGTPGPAELEVATPAPITRTRSRPQAPVVLPTLLSRLSSVSSSSDSEGSVSLVGQKRSRDLVAPHESEVKAVFPVSISTSTSSATSEVDADTDSTDAEADESASASASASEPVGKRRKMANGTAAAPRRVQPRRGSREPPAQAPAAPRRQRTRQATTQSLDEARAKAASAAAARVSARVVAGDVDDPAPNANGTSTNARSSRRGRAPSKSSKK